MAPALVSCNRTTGTTTNVTLLEFSVTSDAGSVPAGLVPFHVTNKGDEDHEFLVIKTDLAPSDLPSEDDGSYQENGPGIELLDEIEPILPSTRENFSLCRS